ncbi:MAG: MarC family protein [Saprospiraceae bacterium]
MDPKEILSIFLILFSVIDIPGNVPIIISMKEKGKIIKPGRATLVAGGLMIAFLLVGESLLGLFGIDVQSFAIAGAIVLFIIAMEMILGVTLFKEEEGIENDTSTSIVPVAFPLIAGAGTMTTIISLKAEFHQTNILIGIILNLIIVFIVLRSSSWIQRKLGKGGEAILRKVFGIILLAIAIKLFKSNIGALS